MDYNYILGLGSNIEPRQEYLANAISDLKSIGTIIIKSSIYETEALGYKNQLNFYNAIIKYTSSLSPRELLLAIKEIEKSIGRKNTFKWGPREIDIDIIFCQDYTLNESDLKIPHPEYSGRRFVLEPMLEIDKDYAISDSNKTIADFLASCEDQSSIHKLDLIW
jgi:2-amino-4-hydroxy-6-hydroxymethyldihydropteridine diphosphokinase